MESLPHPTTVTSICYGGVSVLAASIRPIVGLLNHQADEVQYVSQMGMDGLSRLAGIAIGETAISPTPPLHPGCNPY